jgi:hypothetical protein
MSNAEKLATELNRIAPDWDWNCEEKRADTPVMIAPPKIEISATSKGTGTKTIPIEVSGLKNAPAYDTAKFVCQILMIETPGGAKAKSLLVESSERPGNLLD